MEITPQIKEKVVFSYLGSKYTFIDYSGVKNGIVNTVDTHKYIHSIYFKLKLKPLSAITDEDAIEAIKLIKCSQTSFGFMTEFSLVEKIKKAFIECKMFPSDAYQCLQSKGYDLPNYHLGGKKLYEVGLAIY